MNENIANLAEQAAQESALDDTCMNLEVSVDDKTYQIPGAFIEKFAELIIRDCGKISNEYLGRRIGDIDLDMVYKEHFGVEE